VTIATNMAGRGTDILLGPEVAASGGLHVIATERHESHRIDRQLFGRAARQGDPGSAVAFTSAEDELVRRFAPRIMTRCLAWFIRRKVPGARWLGRWVGAVVQYSAQRAAFASRRAVMRMDSWLDEATSFSGTRGP